MFSTFGVLHVYGDKPSDNMSLAEWQKEAVLFRAVSVIPFFKNYLTRKMLTRFIYIFLCYWYRSAFIYNDLKNS